jgi:RHS repeat-associated protein
MDARFAMMRRNMINRRAWTIDAFGNRTAQTVSGSPSQPAPQSWTGTMSSSNNNQITKSSSSTQNWTYSASGDVTFDGVNSYLYDGEERICAVSGTFGMYGYLHDGDGDRIAKGTLTSFSCNLATNGFALTSTYVVDKDSQQAAEIQGGIPIHANVSADGKLLATYDGEDTYFALTDWLGTKRAEVGTGGCLSTYASLAYGDELTPSGNCPDATEHHFTGKERDSESGNDFFLARYYSSTTGRFTSPDDASGQNSIDPQSWNLYSYVRNSPAASRDPNGHLCYDASAGLCSSHTGSGTLQDAFRADLMAQSAGAMNIGSELDNDEEFSPFQYTYEGNNYNTFEDWATYLISTPGAYDEVEHNFQLYTQSIQYQKIVNDYMAYENVDQAQAEADISPTDPILDGGHWNFQYAGSDPDFERGNFRAPGSTLHARKHDLGHPEPVVHDDTVNPIPIWHGWNLALHGLIDYLGGHTIFSEGFTF